MKWGRPCSQKRKPQRENGPRPSPGGLGQHDWSTGGDKIKDTPSLQNSNSYETGFRPTPREERKNRYFNPTGGAWTYQNIMGVGKTRSGPIGSLRSPTPIFQALSKHPKQSKTDSFTKTDGNKGGGKEKVRKKDRNWGGPCRNGSCRVKPPRENRTYKLGSPNWARTRGGK